MEIKILDNLDLRYKEKWNKQFVAPNRTCAEGLWRRTQDEATKEKSGWQSPLDCRRRMIHFLDQYDVVVENNNASLVIKDIYLWLCTTLPDYEMDEYILRIKNAAEKNAWESVHGILTKDGISITLTLCDTHPEDIKEGRVFPANYKTLEIVVSSRAGFKPNAYSPWGVLKSGIRKKGTRTNTPHIITDINELKEFMPFQVELGGGPSIELGIPPLNHLHNIYQVTTAQTMKFAFGENDHLIVDILEDYISFYKNNASLAYKNSLLAEPNEFYTVLAELYKNTTAVGDVITNNFDGMVSLVGLSERYVRKYEDSDIVPQVEFDNAAKSLLVVGSHADRRLVQEAARRKGLKIIYVDPEHYTDTNGNELDYPLETLKNEDILLQMKASEFAEKCKELTK